MKSRVYVYRHYNGDPATIEYYDYDHVSSDGSSKAYTFTIADETFNSIKDKITHKGRDGDIVIDDVFAVYDGWDGLKAYFNRNGIVYGYDETVLSKEERYQKQKDQFGEHRCVMIHNMIQFSGFNELNDYEYDYMMSLLKDRDIIWEIPFGWEEDDFVFLKKLHDPEEEEAIQIIMDQEACPIRRKEDCPNEILPYLGKWNIAGKEVEIQWPAKLASFLFVYQKKAYELYPEAMDLDDTRVDHIAKMIENDLKELGCRHIVYYGKLD